MTIKRVIAVLENGDRHVQLDAVLPADTKFAGLLMLPEPHLITGLRSPPSDCVTIRPCGVPREPS